MNLPARMVIIKGTKQFVGGATVEYSDLDILQVSFSCASCVEADDDPR